MMTTPARTRTALAWALALMLAIGGGAAHAQGAPPAPDNKAAPPNNNKDNNNNDDGAGDGAAAAGGADSEAQDIDALRREYLRLRDELFRSRARAAAVASALYSTKLGVFLTYDSGRFYAITRATIRLDGASVYDDTTGSVASDRAVRFEGFVAPGRHQLSIRIEAVGKDDERFTSITESTVVVQAPAGKDVTITARARDEGDIAYAWKKRERGSYQLGLSIKVDTQKRAQTSTARSRSADTHAQNAK